MSQNPSSDKTGSHSFRKDNSRTMISAAIAVFVVGLIGIRAWLWMSHRPPSDITPDPVTSPTPMSTATPAEAPSPSPANTDIADLMGLWYGTFDGKPATLEVTTQTETVFRGVLNQPTDTGDYHISVEGEVTTVSSGSAPTITFTEKGVITQPPNHTWDLCSDRGMLLSYPDGLHWEGTGNSPDGNSSYLWHFTKFPSGTAVDSLLNISYTGLNTSTVELRQRFRQQSARIALIYDQRSTAFRQKDMSGYMAYTASDWSRTSDTGAQSTLEKMRDGIKEEIDSGGTESIDTEMRQAAWDGKDHIAVAVTLHTRNHDGTRQQIKQIDQWRLDSDDKWRCYDEKRLSAPTSEN